MLSSVRIAVLCLLTSQCLQAGRISDLIGGSEETPERGRSHRSERAARTESTESEDSTSVYLEKERLTPYLYQKDPRADFPNGGRDYCCPVALANSLICLARQGCKGLADAEADFQTHVELINTLASADYCGTDPKEGTPPKALLRGLRQYVEDQGYRCQRLEYEGWRDIGTSTRAEVLAEQPELDWLKSAVRNPQGAVWLNVGWYVAGESSGEWKRTGGHWVSLVGYGSEDGNSSASRTLIIRNPLQEDTEQAEDEADAAAQLANDTVRVTLQTRGEVISSSGATRSLNGSYRVAGPGLPMRKGTAAFLDAAVVLVVGKPSTRPSTQGRSPSRERAVGRVQGLEN